MFDCTVMLDNLFWRQWALTICQNKPVGMTVNNSKGFFKISKTTERDGAFHSRYCFRLLRDWKLENVANSTAISAVPFRTEQEDYFSTNGFPGILYNVPFDFQPKFPDFLCKWLAPTISIALINFTPYGDV